MIVAQVKLAVDIVVTDKRWQMLQKIIRKWTMKQIIIRSKK